MTIQALKILVVEDNDALREATLAFLQSQGHFVRGVPSAEDVSDLAGGFLPDIYVIDVGLPEEDGLSLAKRLRASHAGCGIVITTARVQIRERVLGYEHGADIYLTKPVHPDELGAALTSLGSRILSGSDKPEAMVLSFVRLKLSGPKRTVELGASDAKLLSALARAPGRSLERWQIAEIISGDNPDYPSSSAIEMRMSRLRRKLSEAGAHSPAIKAVRKSGYTLCCPVQIQ